MQLLGGRGGGYAGASHIKSNTYSCNKWSPVYWNRHLRLLSQARFIPTPWVVSSSLSYTAPYGVCLRVRFRDIKNKLQLSIKGDLSFKIICYTHFSNIFQFIRFFVIGRSPFLISKHPELKWAICLFKS